MNNNDDIDKTDRFEELLAKYQKLETNSDKKKRKYWFKSEELNFVWIEYTTK